MLCMVGTDMTLVAKLTPKLVFLCEQPGNNVVCVTLRQVPFVLGTHFDCSKQTLDCKNSINLIYAALLKDTDHCAIHSTEKHCHPDSHETRCP